MSLDQTLMLVRAAARRDASVMPATMFSITAASCVLAAGSAEQQQRVVSLLRAGGSIGFALSEASHGSDLLANSCTATQDFGDDPKADRRTPVGYTLDGDKWLVGLGERCQALLVVARTGRRGPAAFSTLLLEGSEVDKARSGIRQSPSGMRGIDFAGFSFEGLQVRDDVLVGEEGRGLETAMKAMQVVRSMSTAANLACADTGLRLAFDFAVKHQVGKVSALELPYCRRELATAAALLLAGDVMALTAARGLHALPRAQSLWSSTAKKVLTDTSEEIFARCADVLGTRSVLREGPYAAFDAARRDNAMVRYIDTSPVANNRLVAAHLGRLAASWRATKDSDPSSLRALAGNGLAQVFMPGVPLPALRVDQLALSDRVQDEILEGLPAGADAVRGAVADGADASVGDAARVTALTRQLERAIQGLLHGITWRQEHRRSDQDDPLELNDLADRLCFLHAAASCVHLWWFNRDRSLFGLPPGSAAWLTPVLDVLLARAYGRHTPLPEPEIEQLLGFVLPLYESGRMFSCTAPELAEHTLAE
ncbi:acyl-CoA dehydrogenase [Streptomyces sp. NPDC051636]|uniref:acyl-CoA dehydrogenase n=1 Tax=Streptomyces sp. NPDC051636 TaxID=3365663 RepID=UPI00379B2B39